MGSSLDADQAPESDPRRYRRARSKARKGPPSRRPSREHGETTTPSYNGGGGSSSSSSQVRAGAEPSRERRGNSRKPSNGT